MACFFTDCSFKDIGKLPKVLLVHHRCQWHRQCMHRRCHWHRRRHSLPVSLTPAKLAIFTARYQRHRWCMTSPVSTTPVRIASPVSLTPMSLGVVDTSVTPVSLGVVDTGVVGCRWHRCRWVSVTPANTWFAGVNDTGEWFFAGVVDTGEAL